MSESPFVARFGLSSYAACCDQFPRACSTCRKPHPTFLSFIEATKSIGKPKLDPDDDEDGAIGVLSFANCACGSTLALRYEDLRQHAAFNQAVRAEAEQSKRPIDAVLLALVTFVNEQARRTPAETPSGAPVGESVLRELGAAMMAILARGNPLLPPFPAAAFKVNELARAPTSTPEQVARALASDATLAAEVLQVVNSPAFSRGKPVTSLPTAITRLGMKEIGRLALAAGIGSANAKTGALLPVRLSLWHRSVTTAVLSRALGELRGLNADACFLAGLLRPLGSLVGTLSLEVFLKEHPTAAALPLGSWLRVLELFRSELGALTAARWKLPRALSEVVSLQPGASSAGAEDARLVDTVVSAAQSALVALEVEVLSEASLASVSGLTPAERQHLAAQLPKLAPAIGSFEAATPGGAAPSLVLPAQPPAPGAPPAADVVFLNLARASDRYRLVSYAPGALVLEGAAPLTEHLLVGLETADQPALVVFGTVRSCTKLGEVQRLVVAPFALTPATQVQLLARTRPA